MKSSILESLMNGGGNYLLPFLWLHGESEEILIEEIEKIYESGIKAFCVESRPHPDFGGSGWWKDMDLIIAKAEEKGMRVWVLDDSHFPTGYANGLIKSKYPERRKKVLTWRVVQGCGPLKSATFVLSDNLPFWGDNAQAKVENEKNIVTVIAAQRISGTGKYGRTIDLTHLVKDNRLVWDLPEGVWCVFTIFETWAKNAPDYANLIDAESVSVLIEAVYEPHYLHYKEAFGKTFAGFFSDEPGFGNGIGISNSEGFMHNEAVGKEKLDLIWSNEANESLRQNWGEDFSRNLLGLWFEVEGAFVKARYDYMDLISRLYQKNFAEQLGNWCRERNVEYIGHIIEDNGAHSRLGCGIGHFFRALYGQDMAGIDSIADQTTPGFSDVVEAFSMAERNGPFYHYALGKLGSSLGHIHPMKKGRAACEIFGAGGWREGIKLMKWNLDHMLVRGINHFVPHAFSAKDFPDLDCPPHFYARGNNPQYRFFGQLMGYANRMCHLFNGGIHIAPVAVIYPAEADWTGRCMPVEVPAKHLLQHQIDFDILPIDVFVERELFNTHMSSGSIKVNKEAYEVLVIPYCEFISSELVAVIEEATSVGVKVIILEDYPEGLCNSVKTSEVITAIQVVKACPVIQAKQLGIYLQTLGAYEVRTNTYEEQLRYYHYQKEASDFFMFFNEAPYETLQTSVTIKIQGHAYWYNALDNYLEECVYQADGDTMTFDLELCPYESKILIIGSIEAVRHLLKQKPNNKFSRVIPLTGKWDLSFSKAKDYPVFEECLQLEQLVDLSTLEASQKFSGTIRYTYNFETKEAIESAQIDLGDVYEIAEGWMNGIKIGTAICPPYRFNGLRCNKGLNQLVIEVTNTLVREVTDFGSLSRVLEPTGLLGPVALKY